MSDSFYGGRRGADFIITKHYNSYAEMAQDFGSSNCSVPYETHVLVSAENLSNVENNTIYKRGFNGPEKLGQIFPPTATQTETVGITNVNFMNYNNIQLQPNVTQNNLTISNSGLVPGKQNNTYNDEIKMAYVNLKDANNHITQISLGFQIPYLTLEFEAEINEEFTNATPVIQQIDNNEHPFFHKYKLNIPRSKGDSFRNLRYTSVSVVRDAIRNNEEIWDSTLRTPQQLTETSLLAYDDNSLLILYDFYPASLSNKITYFLGEFKSIADVNMTNDGNITISYTSGTTKNLGTVRWIQATSIAANGTLTFTYNDGSSEVYDNFIYRITNVNLSPTGLLTIEDNQNETQQAQIKWIENARIDTGDNEGTGSQKFEIKFNDEEDFTQIGNPLNYIMQMEINEQYHLLVLYSDPQKRANATNKVTHKGRNDWVDLGPVKSDNGLLVAGDISKNLTSFTYENILSYLNTTYPTGLLNENAGKILTAGDGQYSKKAAFAFDYAENTWYYIGSFDISIEPSTVLIVKEELTQEDKNNLHIGGFWACIEGDED